MSGRAFDPRFLFSWPNAQVGVMGAEQAANVLSEVKLRQLARDGRTLAAEEIAAIRDPVLADYREQASAWYATSELWDDGVIDPVDTRNALGISISASLHAPIARDPHYGVFRM
jgi:3-methylcrotonyl-CoA carboxylase beta subunit